MIAGPISQAGAKDEKPALNRAPAKSGFDTVLKLAGPTGYRPRYPSFSYTDRNKPTEALFDPRNRQTFGRDVAPPADTRRTTPTAGSSVPRIMAAKGASPENPEEKTEGSTSDHLLHTLAEPQPENPTEDSQTSDLNLAVLQPAGGEKPLGTAADGASQFAQVGLAAYRISPHGMGEMAMAEEKGLLPPGSAAPEGMPLGEAADKTKLNAYFQPGTTGEGWEDGATSVKNAVDLLNLSRKATAPEILDHQAMREKIAAENPQAAQEIFQKPGAVPEAPPALAQHRNLGVEVLLQGNAQLKGETQGRGQGNSGPFQYAEHAGVIQPATGTPPSTAQAATHLGSLVPEGAAQQMIDRIAEQARWLIRKGHHEVTMKLHPEDLGDLHLKVIQKGRDWNVEMTVESQAVKKLIETNLDDLQSKLLAGNENQGEFSFNVDVRDGDDPRRFQTFAPAYREASLLAGVDKVLDANVVLTRQRPLWGRSGVGIFV